MAYKVVTVKSEGEDLWAQALEDELTRQHEAGWMLCAVTARTTSVPQTAGMVASTREEEQFVLILFQ